MRWRFGGGSRWAPTLALLLVLALNPAGARAQVVEVCDVPWIDTTRLLEALRIELGEVDGTFRIEECSDDSAHVSVVRQGRMLARVVPWGDTPVALRVRLIAIVLAELVHTDEALRELARADSDAASGPPSPPPGRAPDDPGEADGVAVEALLRPAGATVTGDVGNAEVRPRLLLELQLGVRIFPPLPVRYTDDELVTMDLGFGVQWRRLLARVSILARSRTDEAGKVRFRGYLGAVGARLLDALDGSWRLQLDVLAMLGLMQARGHIDPRPEDAAGVLNRPSAGLALGLGLIHGRARPRAGLRVEIGYLKGITADQGGRRVGTLSGWNVAFNLSIGLRVDESSGRGASP